MDYSNRNSRTHIVLGSLFTALLLSACGGGGGGGDGDGGGDPRVANAVADAGVDQDVTRGFNVTLDASASTDPDGDALTYAWTQTAGPDVTGGAGVLTGISPNFSAPERVSTLRFQLTVNDGAGDSSPDEIQLMVLENANVALFVDGDNGDDTTGDGSRAKPFKTLAHTLSAVTTNQEDLYVMTRANNADYDESAATLVLPDGTSLYGGYGPDWLRDAQAMPTAMQGASTALRFAAVNFDAWLSGFAITTVDSADASTSNIGVTATTGTAALTLRDNVITTGNVAAGTTRQPGSNYGLLLAGLSAVTVENNIITTGNAGHGSAGSDGNPGSSGAQGPNASGSGRASGGSGNPGGHDGGAGGSRGRGPGGGNGGSGSRGGGSGGAGGSGGSGVGFAGNGGDGGNGGGGSNGAAGSAGVGGNGSASGAFGGGFIPRAGVVGNKGKPGRGGGGGGGGGEASSGSWVGGGGGGGGEGGSGGQGGEGGR
ncbi:MAG: hypothetical protein GXP17_08140, partial [Gammaproteobacteria bacterium]|nr:hypothetical protein [Gammaproteobacteria bacterium]